MKLFYSKIWFVLLSFFYLFPLQASEIKGMYSYMADAGWFRECGQTKRYPVAMEADNIALETAYLKNRYMPGKSLLVSFEGHLAMRPKMEGDGKEEVVVVDQFLTISQQERCTGIVPPSTMANTYWKLVELNGKKVYETKIWQKMAPEISSSIRELHMIIKQGGLLSGFSGCNKFSGQVIFDEDNIRIGPLMSSRTACPAIEMESHFHKLLAKANNYLIKGESLELFQQTPEVSQSVAKFIAIYF